MFYFFFFQAEDGIRDYKVTGVQTCALPIWPARRRRLRPRPEHLLVGHAVQLLARQRRRGLPALHQVQQHARSEERRVGKECRSRRSPDHYKKKKEIEKENHSKDVNSTQRAE